MKHAFTVDVEDSHNLLSRHWLGRDMEPTHRVVENVKRILHLLADCSTRATCFILGEIAEAHPQIVREIADAGHDIGVHGYYHHQVFNLTPNKFREELRTAKSRLEDIVGKTIDGHRAPAFSITAKTRWAWDVLAEEGFTYDSSVFPFKGRRYGWPNSPLTPFTIVSASGSILELPLPVLEIAGKRIPIAGGGYLRMFPYAWNRWCVRSIEKTRPVIVYMHPYEIETEPFYASDSELSLKLRIKLRRLNKTMGFRRSTVFTKLTRLLREFEFGTLRETFDFTSLPSLSFDLRNLPDGR